MIDAQPDTTALTPKEQHVRRAHLTVCLTLLAVLAVAYLAVVLRVIDSLPGRVPVHFGVDGVADGWLDRRVAVVAFGLLSVGLPLLLLVVFAAGQWWRGSSARFISALVCAVAVGLVTLFSALLWSAAHGTWLMTQPGLDGMAEVRMSAWLVLGPLVVAVAVGLLVALVLPPSLPQPEPVVAEPIEIAPSDRVSWFGRAHGSQPLTLVLLAGVLLVVGVTLATGNWWLWLAVLLLLLLFPATTVFRVKVDRDGLAWRSALGVPRGQVALADVTEASVVDARPGDFGGYGIRSVPGATAVVTRHGPALQVRRGQGRTFIITVDDPMAAASVLEGLRRRR